jgi:uncharacterized protein YndB with AHSA1/START domain
MGNVEKLITIQVTIDADISKVWDYWSLPEHIKKWNSSSIDWHTTIAENDLCIGGKFLSRMEAKDGSMGFDFGGVYDEVILNKLIAYTIGDGRKVRINFIETNTGTEIKQSFEAEETNPIEMQKNGWQAILNNFKKYVENN